MEAEARWTYQGEVGVHGVELQVDLFVDSLLGIFVVVLANRGHLERRCTSDADRKRIKVACVRANSARRARIVRADTATARQLKTSGQC